MIVPVLVALQSLAAGETCPAPVDVEARVRTILHLAPERQLDESFLVERHEAGLYVVLKGADTSIIGERTLPLEGSCNELAQAAAVVLSAWLSDVHPDFAGNLPPRDTEPPPEPPPEPPRLTPPKPKTEPLVKPAEEPRIALPTNHFRLDLALGVGGDLTALQVAPAGALSIGFGPERSGIGALAFAVLSTWREQQLGPGVVRWRRWPIGIGPSLRLSTASLNWDFATGPALAWLQLVGDNFDEVDTHDIPAWGGFLNVRAAGRGIPFAPFAAANLQIYPSNSVAYVTNLQDEWPLPVASFVVTLGARFAH